MVYAKVVLDSIGPNSKRLISVEACYWRAIHAEIMTHRDRARNAASSRAIPFYRLSKDRKPYDEIIAMRGVPVGEQINGLHEYVIPNCTYSKIHNDPFIPEFIGSEQPGMQSGTELAGENRMIVEDKIRQARFYMLSVCLEMYHAGAHKSIINRYLEPWSYITVIMTATEWKNFFRLRIHPKAEKHFNQIATLIKEAIDKSVPQSLSCNQWHMPYLRSDDHEIVDTYQRDGQLAPIGSDFYLKRISAARCARLSYLTHDGRRDIFEDLKLFDKLINPKIEEERDDDVIHSSPLEHVAQASNYEYLRSGPFSGWYQFRKDFPNENVPG